MILRKYRFVQLCLIGLVSLSLQNAWALKTDQNQPTKLASDTADFNDVNQEYILTGHVVIIKGSIVIKGVKAVVVVDPEGYQKITVIGNDAVQASFTQQMDKPNPEFVDGQGDLILYEAKNDQLLLSGQAYTVRRHGLMWKDKLLADQIQYDLYTEEYKAISSGSQKMTQSILGPREAQKIELTNSPKK
jgi:lipopolysaccharide export system protein LptA